MTRSDEERFADILQAIQRCQDYEPYLRSEELASMAYDAVLRNLAVIGEAVRSLPSETRDRMPDVPWAAIAGLRNIVVHEYFRVNPDLILDLVDAPGQDAVEHLRVEGVEHHQRAQGLVHLLDPAGAGDHCRLVRVCRAPVLGRA